MTRHFPALDQALQAEPDNATLRAHLVQLLLDADDPVAALDHAQLGLLRQPAHLDLLRLGARAARACNAERVMDGYNRILTALTSPSVPANVIVPEAIDRSDPSTPSTAPEPSLDLRQEPPPAPEPSTDVDTSVATPILADDQRPSEPALLAYSEPAAPIVPTLDRPVEQLRDHPTSESPRPRTQESLSSADDLLALWDRMPSETTAPVVKIGRSPLTLDSLAGMREVKHLLEVVCLGPMRHPELRSAWGSAMPSGVLLWGPPGCGKTAFGQAIAGELGAKLHHVRLASALDAWSTSGTVQMDALFELARSNTPSVLFLDELDALFAGPADPVPAPPIAVEVLGQLLRQFDSAAAAGSELVVIGACRRPWNVDPSLLRPGRLHRNVFVPPPDIEARRAVFDEQLVDFERTSDVDLGEFAGRTNGYSVSDVAFVCAQATEYAIFDSIEDGRIRPLTPSDLRRSMGESRPSPRAWFDAARRAATDDERSDTWRDVLAWLGTEGMR